MGHDYCPSNCKIQVMYLGLMLTAFREVSWLESICCFFYRNPHFSLSLHLLLFIDTAKISDNWEVCLMDTTMSYSWTSESNPLSGSQALIFHFISSFSGGQAFIFISLNGTIIFMLHVLTLNDSWAVIFTLLASSCYIQALFVINS